MSNLAGLEKLVAEVSRLEMANYRVDGVGLVVCLRRMHKPFYAVLVSLATTSLSLLAQETDETSDTLDPYTVYGEVSNYQAWPLSASAVSGADLDTTNRDDQRELSAVIPNMAQTDSGLRSYGDVASMRGLTNTPFFGSPSVVQYVDDVPMGNVFSQTTQFHAVDRVEVFRGPQGWLFGRNPYGGVVNVISKAPTDLWEGSFGASYGSYESFVGDGYVMGPLIEDKLAIKLGGAYSKRNGFLYNPTLRTHPDDQQHASGSGTIYWRPARGWEVRLSAHFDEFDDGGPRLTPLAGDPYVTTADVHGEARQRSNSQSLRVSYEGDRYKFLSVTARRDWELDPYYFDLDLGPFPGNDSIIVQDQELLSQEFRWSSVGEGDWEWTVGAYASITDIAGNTTRNFLAPGPGGMFFPITTLTDYSLDEENYAAFGQVSYDGIDRWGFHAGLRLEHYEKEMRRDAFGVMGPVPRIEDRDSFFFVSPRLGIDFELDDTSLVYLSTGLTFKPGGFSAFVDDPSIAAYDEERSWTTELGWKKSWFDDTVRTNLAVFYNKIRDYQVERSLVATDYAVLNAERADSYGAEFELQAQITDSFSIEGSVGVVKTEFDRFTDPLTGADLSGNRAPFVPEIDASIAAVYRHSSGFFGRVEVVHQGETFFSDLNNSAFREPGYTLLNAAVGFESEEGFQFTIYGQNLTEEVFYQNISPDLQAGTVGAPMLVGVRCRYNF